MLGNVLLLDDDAFCNKINTFVIEQRAAASSIVTFGAALEALDYLRTLIAEDKYDSFPDLILLDLNMTYMDGWGFLEQFRTLPAAYKNKVSIYILTSSIQASDRQAAELHESVNGYLEKPFTASELEFILVSQASRFIS